MGIEGNEVADTMSKLGYNSPDSYTTMTPPSYMKTWCKEKKADDFQRYLEQSVKESNSRKVPNRKRFKNIRNEIEDKNTLERWANMSLFRIRNGHTLTNSHFNRFDKKRDIKCRYCVKDEETPEHLLLHCQHFYPTDWWARHSWNELVRKNYRGYSFNEIVVKGNNEMLRRLKRIMYALKEFGVVI